MSAMGDDSSRWLNRLTKWFNIKSVMPSRTHADAREERLDLVFHALADRTRRSLLRRLGRGPAMVTELAEPFSISLPAVSKHLRVLERARLVSRQVDGRVHRCSLEPQRLGEVEEWLHERRAFWEQTLESLAAHLAPEGADSKRT